MILTADGNAYGFGDNLYGRIGSGKSDTSFPEKVALSNITDISAGGYGSLFVSNGEAYGTGRDWDAALNLGANAGASYSTPQKVLDENDFINENVKTVFIHGAQYSVQTSFIITNDGYAYSLGSNDSASLGIGKTGSAGGASANYYDETYPTKIGKVGAQFNLEGSSLNHDNSGDYQMLYSSDVTISGVLTSGGAIASPNVTINGTTITYNGSYTVEVADGQEQEVEISVKYNGYTNISYKFVIDKKPPSIENLQGKNAEPLEDICNIVNEVYHCNASIDITFSAEQLSSYMYVATKNIITNEEIEYDLDTFNNSGRKLEYIFNGFEEKTMQYILTDKAGNTASFTIALDNVSPRM